MTPEEQLRKRLAELGEFNELTPDDVERLMAEEEPVDLLAEIERRKHPPAA